MADCVRMYGAPSIVENIGPAELQSRRGFLFRKQAMPYKSLAQERYFNANRSKLERQGVNVSEWNRASKGKKLPKRKRKKRRT